MCLNEFLNYMSLLLAYVKVAWQCTRCIQMKNHLQIMKYTIASTMTNNHNKKLVVPIYQISNGKRIQHFTIGSKTNY